ncbi:hypothetical protein [Desulfovulcanus sp.]
MNIIRGKTPSHKDVAHSSSGSKTKGIINFSFSTQTVTIGIDLREDHLRLAKITKKDKYLLIDYKKSSYPHGIKKDHPDFIPFLKSNLDSFKKNHPKAHLWAIIPAINVNTFFIRIPKVEKKQIYNTVYWSVNKEKKINLQEQIFDFKILGETTVNGVPKIEVLAYTAPINEVTKIKTLFKNAEHKLKGITTIPFCLSNYFHINPLDKYANNIAHIFIGTDWSRIDIFNRGNLAFTREIKTGTKSLAQSLQENYHVTYPDLSESQNEEILIELDDLTTPEPTSPKISLEQATQILFQFCSEEDLGQPQEQKFDFTKDQVLKWITPALDRIISQIERTFNHYITFLNKGSVDKVYLSGIFIPSQKCLDYIQDQIGIPFQLLDPFQGETIIDSANIHLSLSLEEKIAATPVIGAALSSNELTPNFLYTTQERKRERNSKIIRQISAGVFILCALASIGIYFNQTKSLEQKSQRLAILKNELNQYQPQVTQKLINSLLQKIVHNNNLAKQYAQRYSSIAILSELSGITSKEIKLLSFRSNFSPKDNTKSLVINGIITGEPQLFESRLASYILRINNSLIFDQVKILKQGIQLFADFGQVLNFTLEINFK